MRSLWAAAALSTLSLGLAGCGGCTCGRQAESEDHVAELVSASGAVERDVAGREGQWEAAAQGARFRIGDAIRTGAGGAAVVELRSGGRLRLGENSFIRFLADAPETRQPRVQLETGGAEVSGGSLGVEVRTPTGSLVVDESSEVSVDYTARERVRFEVTVGRASFLDQQNTVHALTRGDLVVVNTENGAVLRPPRGGEASAEGADAGPAPDAAPPVATGPVTLDVDGAGAEAQGPGSRRFVGVEPGESTVEEGTALRVGPRTSVGVRRGDGSAILATGSRATVGGEGGALLHLTGGRAVAGAGAAPTLLRVPGGTILLRPHARGEVAVDRTGRTEVRAIRGELELHGDGEPQVIGLGDAAHLARDGEVDVRHAPSRSAITVLSGASATIHDPSPPTAVAIRIGEACAGEAVVEVVRPDAPDAPLVARGTDRAILWLPTGTHQYRVRCTAGGVVSESVAVEGSVRIIGDPGTTPMPTTPAHNTVDADGRAYTVLYQNVLPEITFRWSTAPEAAAYVLTVSGPGGHATTRRGPRPSQTFGGGTLSEGTYQFRFETSAGARSPEGTLRIRFDTAVAVVSIREPALTPIAPGETVTVAGTALRGATVSVGGTEIPFDGPFRFEGTVTAPTDEDALVIRVSHPSSGVHFYLRHLTVSPRR